MTAIERINDTDERKKNPFFSILTHFFPLSLGIDDNSMYKHENW